MKIIQIIRNFSLGGAERFTIDLANQLFLDGHEVTIIRFFDDSNQNALLGDVNPNVRIITEKKRKGFDAFLILRLYRRLKKENPDVVNTHLNGFTYSIMSFFLLHRTKFFHTLHSMPLKEAKNKADLISKKYLFGSGIVTPVSISSEVHEAACRLYRNKVRLVLNGRSKPGKTAEYDKVKDFISSLRTGDNCRILVNVANYRPVKNQGVLIDAVKYLNSQGYNLKLLLIGGDKTSEIYEDFSKRVDANIFLLGTLNNVQDYLYSVDFFCLSSLYEGMPISLIEAFSTGCIPVCTPAGGICSMIEDGINGFLTQGFTSADFADTLRKVMDKDRSELQDIRNRAAKSFDEKYSIATCARGYLKIYSSQVSEDRN